MCFFSVDKQYHYGDFFNRLITDFEARAPMLNDSWRHRAVQSTTVPNVLKEFLTKKLGLNKKQWDRGEKETSTKDFACSSVDNF